MPEATMLVLDNSEYMRNGDFIPTRWGAQSDAATIVFDAKTQAHPENVVGVMTMAGKSPQVLSTLSNEIGKFLQSVHNAQITGNSDVSTSINIAQLALKHRQNKAHGQRIIAFVGSPVDASEEELIAIGKKLKKNNVALDIINYGEGDVNETKLQKLIESVNSGENSHLVTFQAGTQLLSDLLISSPILMADGGAAAGPSGSGGGNFEFGVDPSMDPELAMALRMSLEEEQARQRAADGGSSAAPSLPAVTEAAEPGSTAASASSATASSASTSARNTSATAPPRAMPSGGSLVPPNADALGGTSEASMDESEDALLKQALALSQQGAGGNDDDVEMGSAEKSNQSGKATVAGRGDGDEDEEMTEEEAIARAIEMSLQGEGEGQGGSGSKSK